MNFGFEFSNNTKLEIKMIQCLISGIYIIKELFCNITEINVVL